MPYIFNSLSSYAILYGFQTRHSCGSAGKESACNAGDLGLIPGLERSPGERKGYPLQYSGLENSMDCIVHGITKSRTRLSDFHFTSLHCVVLKPFGEENTIIIHFIYEIAKTTWKLAFIFHFSLKYL